MIHYQTEQGVRCGVEGDASTEWEDVTCLACLFRDVSTLPEPKRRFSPRQRIASVGLLLAVMFGASACQVFEDGSWRDGPDHGCLIPELGCDGPLIHFGATSAPDPNGVQP